MARFGVWLGWVSVVLVTISANAVAQSPLQDRANGAKTVASDLVSTSTDPVVLRQAMNASNPTAYERVVQLAVDRKVPTQQRVELVGLLAQFGGARCVPRLLEILTPDEQPEVELAVLQALIRFDDPQIPTRVFQEYPRYSDKLKRASRQVLFAHKPGALEFLERVDRKQYSAQFVSIDELRRLESLADEPIHKLILKQWGHVSRVVPEARLAEIRRWSQDLRAEPGKAKAGKAVFKEHCAKCHKIFGEGESIAPDLTLANRKDREYVLTSLIDPSEYIRADYLPSQVVTNDGRILQGLIVEQSDSTLTLVNSNAEKTKIARGDIDEVVPSETSAMPEGLLKPLALQQVRDLIAFLESEPESTGSSQNYPAPKPPPL